MPSSKHDIAFATMNSAAVDACTEPAQEGLFELSIIESSLSLKNYWLLID